MTSSKTCSQHLTDPPSLHARFVSLYMALQPSLLAQFNGTTGTTTSVQVGQCSSRPHHSHIASLTPSNLALRIRPSKSHNLATIPPHFQQTIVHAVSLTSVSVDPLAPDPPQSSTPYTPQTVSVKKQQFIFDQVHGPSTTQHAIFTSTTSLLISRFLEGFNCAILAYGQTSAGKMHTMTSFDLDADPTNPENDMGIIPRAVAMIFARARELCEEQAGA